jgi:tetratricopeptide (TPR) repeat protein
MFQEKFSLIFAELDSIESKLKTSKNTKEREDFSQRLLELRRVMDQCIQSWLCFEERVNQLQDHYGLNLPDEVPDLLFAGLGLTELEEPDLEAQESPPGGGKPGGGKPGGGTEKGGAAGDLKQVRRDASLASFKRGLGFYDLYMLEEAIQEFENLVHLEPDFIIGHFLLGHAYSLQGNQEKAEKEFRLVLALTEDSLLKAMVYNALGNICAGRGKYEQALEEFYLSRESSPEVREAHFNLAATYYNLGRYRDSIEYFSLARKYYPEDWEILFYLGKAHQYLKEYEEALPYLEGAARMNPRDSLVHFELGILYHLLGKRDKAISQYIRTLELNKEKGGRLKAPRLN